MLKKIKALLIQWIMGLKIYNYLLLKIIPYIRFTTYYTSFEGWKYHLGYKVLKKGDIILTRDNKKLTTLLIGGEFTHAALCVSKDKNFEVAEMTHKNFTKSCFFDICKESDRVVILRCYDWDEDYITKVIEECKSHENAHYDSKFSLGVKLLYCSELIYMSDIEKRLKVSLEDLAGIGQPYISPTGLYKAENIKVIWDSAKTIN